MIQAVKTAADLQGTSCTFLVRSDSTLRGHFPLELNTVVNELSIQPDARFFILAFFEAGRFTENDTQWVMTADGPVFCGDSELVEILCSVIPQDIYPHTSLKKPDVQWNLK